MHTNITGDLSNCDLTFFRSWCLMCWTWLLKDNQSTMNQSINPTHFTNMNDVKTSIHFYSNAGCSINNKKGGFGLLDVWYNPQRIALFLSKPLNQSTKSHKRMIIKDGSSKYIYQLDWLSFSHIHEDYINWIYGLQTMQKSFW